MDYMERMLKGIEYMEANLARDMELEEISSQAAMSAFHFHRIFTALTGDTPGDYMRSRRLTKASMLLSESDRRILDIALDAGYQSQEAFTRAFKKNFRTTPNRFRKKGYSSHFLGREPLSRDTVAHLVESVTLEPEIKEMDSFTLCGYQGATSKAKPRIFWIWQKLLRHASRIPGRTEDDILYGLSEYQDPSDFTIHSDFQYLAGAKVQKNQSAPKGMVTKTVPAGRWAVFQHRGPVKLLPETFDYIYGPWALRTKETIREADDLEVYGPEFNPRNPENSLVELYIPIV